MPAKNKVLLIHPGKPTALRIPLSLLCLAESLKESGYDVKIIDLVIGDKIDNIDFRDILFVGITAVTLHGQIYSGYKIAKKIKEIHSRIPVVWGGMHPSSLPYETIQSPLVDIIVLGEGEETIGELARRLEQGASLSDVRGIVYKLNGNAITTAKRDMYDFNDYQYLPYELLDLQKYGSHRRMEYESSRGCIHKCSFCSKPAYFCKNVWRAKDAEIVIDELNQLNDRFHPEFIDVVDDDFFFDTNRVIEICEGLLKRKLMIDWNAFCRADYLEKYDLSFLRLVKKSGCSGLFIGVESGSAKIQGLVNKGITREQVIGACLRCKEIGIIPTFGFMSGFIGETTQDFNFTLDLIDKLKKTNSNSSVISISLAAPLPGSDFFEEAKRMGFDFPQSLEGWANQNFDKVRLFHKNRRSWLDDKFIDNLYIYQTILSFFYWWRYSTSQIMNIKRTFLERCTFILYNLFMVLFYPFFISRWSKRYTRLAVEVNLWRILRNRFLVDFPIT